MPVTPDDLAHYADHVFAEANTEVELRAAASKAYYSAFHTVCPLGDMIPDAPKHVPGTHQRLCHQLLNDCPPGADREDQEKIRRLGQLMANTRDVRQQADYDLGKEFSTATARKAVDRSKEIRSLYGSLNYLQQEAG